MLDALHAIAAQPDQEPFDAELEIAQLESATLEFKSSLKTPTETGFESDQHRREVLKRIEIAAAKTLARFMNAEGGTLPVSGLPGPPS